MRGLSLLTQKYQNIGAEIHVDMYDNQMVISSPGGMVNGNKIQELDFSNTDYSTIANSDDDSQENVRRLILN